MILFEFVEHTGDRVLTHWSLQKAQRNRLNNRLRMVAKFEREFVQGTFFFKTGTSDIWKFKVRGNVQLRPMACFGPLQPDSEATFLTRATERDDEFVPPNAAEIAGRQLARLRADCGGRRVKYDIPKKLPKEEP